MELPLQALVSFQEILWRFNEFLRWATEQAFKKGSWLTIETRVTAMFSKERQIIIDRIFGEEYECRDLLDELSMSLLLYDCKVLFV